MNIERVYEREVFVEKTRDVHVEKRVPKIVEKVVENPYYVDNIVDIDEKDIDNFRRSNRVDEIMPTEVNKQVQ